VKRALVDRIESYDILTMTSILQPLSNINRQFVERMMNPVITNDIVMSGQVALVNNHIPVSKKHICQFRPGEILDQDHIENLILPIFTLV
jgi:hypothetical protein